MHHEYIKRKTITNYRSERTFWNPKWICINKQKIIYTSVQIIRMLIRITSYLKSEEKHEISKFNLFCCCWSDYQLNFEEKKNRILNVTNLFIIIIHATTVDKLVEKDNDVSSFHGHQFGDDSNWITKKITAHVKNQEVAGNCNKMFQTPTHNGTYVRYSWKSRERGF